MTQQPSVGDLYLNFTYITWFRLPTENSEVYSDSESSNACTMMDYMMQLTIVNTGQSVYIQTSTLSMPVSTVHPNDFYVHLIGRIISWSLWENVLHLLNHGDCEKWIQPSNIRTLYTISRNNNNIQILPWILLDMLSVGALICLWYNEKLGLSHLTLHSHWRCTGCQEMDVIA